MSRSAAGPLSSGAAVSSGSDAPGAHSDICRFISEGVLGSPEFRSGQRQPITRDGAGIRPRAFWGLPRSIRILSRIWDAIESGGEVANLKIRSNLMSTLCEELKRRKLSQAQAAKILGVTQPRVSDLMRGRVDLFSVDALVNMHNMLGLPVAVTTTNEALVQIQKTRHDGDPKTLGQSGVVRGSPLQ